MQLEERRVAGAQMNVVGSAGAQGRDAARQHVQGRLQVGGGDAEAEALEQEDGRRGDPQGEADGRVREQLALRELDGGVEDLEATVYDFLGEFVVSRVDGVAV